MKDIPAILDAVGSEKAAVTANIGGGILAIPFAAAHPERVASLILVDCFARFQAAHDFPIGAAAAAVAPALDQAEDSPGRGIQINLFASLVTSEHSEPRGGICSRRLEIGGPSLFPRFIGYPRVSCRTA